MTDLRADVLQELRAGPSSSHALARRLGVPPSRVYRTLAVLVESGWAVHPKRQEWQLSERGREWFRAPRLFRTTETEGS